MCQQDIFVVIYDRKKKNLVEYRSDDDFDIQVLSALLDDQNSRKRKNYSNDSMKSEENHVAYTKLPLKSL